MKTNRFHQLAPLSTLAVLFAVLALSSPGWTKVEYDSSRLLMMNSEQISDFVRKKIKIAQDIQTKQEDKDDGDFLAEPAAVDALKDAMRIVLARPDQDGERANAFARVRREMVDLDVLEKSLDDIATEAIANIKNSQVAANRVATYVVILESLMAELKPEISDNAAFKKIVTQIRDAKLKISDKVKNQQRMGPMSKLTSPSDTAVKILAKPK
jgi:hypothetical protein